MRNKLTTHRHLFASIAFFAWIASSLLATPAHAQDASSDAAQIENWKYISQIFISNDESDSAAARKQLKSLNRLLRKEQEPASILSQFMRFAIANGGLEASKYFQTWTDHIRKQLDADGVVTTPRARASLETQRLLTDALADVYGGRTKDALGSLEKLQTRGKPGGVISVPNSVKPIDTRPFFAWALALNDRGEEAAALLTEMIDAMHSESRDQRPEDSIAYRDTLILLTTILEHEGEWERIEALCKKTDDTVSVVDEDEAVIKLIAASQRARAALRTGDPAKITLAAGRLQHLRTAMSRMHDAEIHAGAFIAWLQESGSSVEAADQCRKMAARLKARPTYGSDPWVFIEFTEVVKRREAMSPSPSPSVSWATPDNAFNRTTRTHGGDLKRYQALLIAKPFEVFSLRGLSRR